MWPCRRRAVWPSAATGWRLIGAGRPTARAERVRRVSCATWHTLHTSSLLTPFKTRSNTTKRAAMETVFLALCAFGARVTLVSAALGAVRRIAHGFGLHGHGANPRAHGHGHGHNHGHSDGRMSLPRVNGTAAM